MYNRNQLEILLEKINIKDYEKLKKLEIYIENLTKWNKVINLTSKNFEAIKHIQDSLMFFEVIKNPSGNLIDIGSGNGFPAIIIAILSNKLNVTMVEQNIKKSAFLRDTIYKLQIDAKVLNTNILEVPTETKFSFVTLRGLKCNCKMQTKIHSLLPTNKGKLVIWTYPPPHLKYFKLLHSFSKNNKHIHVYIKEQAEQQPI
ncbi:MAG: 16S rRNA (guanine(527)-N(7))-methyltransferase RsmG [Desulfurella sp.]|nr:MAG: 16S rRNA (guanine(527)-N(7))-methyltransferase RsmG [Desulfurella sp.]